MFPVCTVCGQYCMELAEGSDDLGGGASFVHYCCKARKVATGTRDLEGHIGCSVLAKRKRAVVRQMWLQAGKVDASVLPALRHMQVRDSKIRKGKAWQRF